MILEGEEATVVNGLEESFWGDVLLCARTVGNGLPTSSGKDETD